jgi:hypothetical protein
MSEMKKGKRELKLATFFSVFTLLHSKTSKGSVSLALWGADL